MKFNEEYYNKIISNIIEIRKNFNFTQKEFSEKINMSYIIYGHIESKRRELKIMELVHICFVFNLDINRVLEIEKKEKSHMEKENDRLKGLLIKIAHLTRV